MEEKLKKRLEQMKIKLALKVFIGIHKFHQTFNLDTNTVKFKVQSSLFKVKNSKFIFSLRLNIKSCKEGKQILARYSCCQYFAAKVL